MCLNTWALVGRTFPWGFRSFMRWNFTGGSRSLRQDGALIILSYLLFIVQFPNCGCGMTSSPLLLPPWLLSTLMVIPNKPFLIRSNMIAMRKTINIVWRDKEWVLLLLHLDTFKKHYYFVLLWSLGDLVCTWYSIAFYLRGASHSLAMRARSCCHAKHCRILV